MIVSAAWIVPAVFAVINRIAQARLQGWEPATWRELLFEFGDFFQLFGEPLHELEAFVDVGIFAAAEDH